MIKIEERIPQKIPGLTSLFISFIYNKDTINNILEIIKEHNVYSYNKTTYEWELPIIELSYLIEHLKYIDDIELKLLECNTNDKKVITKVNYKLQPFKHQLEAIEYGLKKDSWLLLDKPGLGKTSSIIHLAEELKEQRNLEHCLVICGVNTLKTNWQEEIAKHSNLSCKILGKKVNSKGTVTYESVEKRAEQLANKIDEFFIITNIETFRSDTIVTAFKNSINNIDMIVVDECHTIKNPNSRQGKNLLKLTNSKYKIGLTGTLLLNDPLDAYVPLKWIGEEKSNLTTFKQFYCNFVDKQIVGFKNINVLKEQINNCSLRRTKELLNLPPKTLIDEIVDMSDEHKKLYNDVKKGIKESVDKVKINNESLRAMLIRLRQATACPSLLTSQPVTSSKVDRAVDLAEQIISNGDKVVIFSTFKETVNILNERLKKYNPIILTGDVKDSYVFEMKEKFQNDENYKLLIATWQKMGTGVTLNAASYLIFIDTPYTYGVYEQCCDRIHRIGSKKPVFIYNLICKDTADELVQKILARKEAIGDYIIDDVLTENSMEILSRYIQDL